LEVFPLELGDIAAAVLRIKNEAKKGDKRAIEALNKIQKSFDIV